MSTAHYQTMSLPVGFLKQLMEVMTEVAMASSPRDNAVCIRDSILSRLNEMCTTDIVPLSMPVVLTADPLFPDGAITVKDLIEAFSFSGKIEVAKFIVVASAMTSQLFLEQIRIGIEARFDAELYNVRAALFSPQVKDMVDVFMSVIADSIAVEIYQLQLSDMVGRQR